MLSSCALFKFRSAKQRERERERDDTACGLRYIKLHRVHHISTRFAIYITLEKRVPTIYNGLCVRARIRMTNAAFLVIY